MIVLCITFFGCTQDGSAYNDFGVFRYLQNGPAYNISQKLKY